MIDSVNIDSATLRKLADKAQAWHQSADSDALERVTYGQAVEDVCRYLAGDARPTTDLDRLLSYADRPICSECGGDIFESSDDIRVCELCGRVAL